MVGRGSVNFFRTIILYHFMFSFMFSSRFMLFPTFLENKIFQGGGGGGGGCKKRIVYGVCF